MNRSPLAACILVCALATITRAADPPAPSIATRYVAIDNVCAWPNLTALDDGTIVAAIFNQPSHGRAEGDVECWATRDGLLWSRRGTAAPHAPAANRMNVAAGKAGDALVVLASGWSLKKDPDGNVTALDQILSPWICRSDDGGGTWQIDRESFPQAAPGQTHFIPFGDILAGADGAPRAACYARDAATRRDAVWLFRADVQGRRWSIQAKIGDAHNETAILHLGAGRWLAAARALGETRQRLDLFRSDDDGRTWTERAPLSDASQHPAHLARLEDGRILLTYGNRVKGQYGVLAKLSADAGETWSAPLTLVGDLLGGDCGYPASVQREDGKVLTAYYSNGAPAHRRYHMGVVLWEPPAR